MVVLDVRLSPCGIRAAIEDSGSALSGKRAGFQCVWIGKFTAVIGQNNRKKSLKGLYAYNLKEAVKWYRKAAEQGLAVAQFNLGIRYHKGEGVEKDLKEAVKWYRKAAAQGNVDAKKMLERANFKSIGILLLNLFF